jgi:hypothetical protein
MVDRRDILTGFAASVGELPAPPDRFLGAPTKAEMAAGAVGPVSI